MIRGNTKYCSFILAIFLLGIVLALPAALEAKAGNNTKLSLDLRTAISKVAKENIPAVVHIEVTQRQEMINPMLPFESDPFFRYFFDVPNMPRKFRRELKGLGTGIMMDAKGYILTNNHVVGNATGIDVLLSNGKQYKAKLIGSDPKTDLAVIKVEAKEPLPRVSFGDSDQVDVGTWVVAIGHPRGLDHTITQGIISAKHRRGITDPNTYQDFLQTDAAINPGNSGGPLLNLEGEVIGANAAIVSQSGGFEGIGFAIPANMALHVAKELIAHGKVVRGWLGVSVQTLTPDLAKALGLEGTKGALVADVVKDGPAHKAGIKRGNVIIACSGKEISDADSLRNEVAATRVGKMVKVNLLRKGEKRELSVTIENLELAKRMRASSLRDRLGAEVREVTVKEAQRYDLSADQGVTIIWLDFDGPLGKAGFELGDIILEVNSEPVQDLKNFVDLVSSLRTNEQVLLLALDHRTGQTGYVQVVVR
jgi:serine protease Do